MMTAWVTGAGGFIGSNIVRAAAVHAPELKVIPLTRRDLDLTDAAAVVKRFAAERPEIIIHCAAMSRSPDCQTNPSAAWQINFEVTSHLASLQSRLVFLSTDLVFDGRKGNYVETDEPNPLSVYAETKVAAEKIVLQNPKHSVVRCALVGGQSPRGNHAFNEDLRAAWKAGRTTKLFHDEFRTPIIAPIAARAVLEIASRNLTGLFHLGGAEKLSRLQLGELVAARHPELTARIESCSLREYQGPPRPADASLNCIKLQNLLSCKLVGLNDWLKQHPDAEF